MRLTRLTLAALGLVASANVLAAPSFTGLGFLSDARYSQASGLSGDGVVVVSFGAPSKGGPQGFRWSAPGGIANVGNLPNGSALSLANGVSADASTIVGDVFRFDPRAAGPIFEAHRVTSAGSFGLGILAGGITSNAYEASADGAVVVGSSGADFNTATSRTEAFRWTESSGMVGLGDLPGGAFGSRAEGVSSDGRAIVGTSVTSAGDKGTSAFLWDEANGLRDLQEVLAAQGLGGSLGGWKLQRATAVATNAEGLLVVTGYGLDPNGERQAFVATLAAPVPEPATLAALTFGALALLRRRKRA